MMTRRILRFLFSAVMALLFASASLLIAQAQTEVSAAPTPTPAPGATAAALMVTYDNCVDCHQNIVDNWKMAPHGQSLVDPVFTTEWNNQGKPGACLVCHATGYDPATGKAEAEGVTCRACHSPIPANHPVDNMPVDDTPDLCGKCHSDARFATENWQMSAHYKRSMTCSVCHDPHTAGMKIIEGAPAMADASNLCANCHQDAMKNFPTSKHSAAGVTCVNCHLGFNVGTETGPLNFITAHRAPDHNFMPSLDTCNKCHANQMHAPGQAAAAAAIKVEEVGGTPTPQPTQAATAIPHTATQPAPVSPLGFAAMAALLGLAGGMVLAPWLERAYRKGKGD